MSEARSRSKRTKTAAIVQARMGSSRLPGKVLMDVGGEPLLARVSERLSRVDELSRVVVATSVEPRDDVIEEFCIRTGRAVYRGSEADVLDRYYRAAKHIGAEVVVRITADCPLIPPDVVRETVGRFFDPPAVDYCSNRLPPRQLPSGTDVEVFTFAALERAWAEASSPYDREHVTSFIYAENPAFSLRGVHWEADLSDIHLSVDTPGDLELVRRVHRALDGRLGTWSEITEILRRNIDWLKLNRSRVPEAWH